MENFWTDDILSDMVRSINSELSNHVLLWEKIGNSYQLSRYDDITGDNVEILYFGKYFGLKDYLAGIISGRNLE